MGGQRTNLESPATRLNRVWSGRIADDKASRISGARSEGANRFLCVPDRWPGSEDCVADYGMGGEGEGD
jgi:hypothetical protein